MPPAQDKPTPKPIISMAEDAAICNARRKRIDFPSRYPKAKPPPPPPPKPKPKALPGGPNRDQRRAAWLADIARQPSTAAELAIIWRMTTKGASVRLYRLHRRHGMVIPPPEGTKGGTWTLTAKGRAEMIAAQPQTA